MLNPWRLTFLSAGLVAVACGPFPIELHAAEIVAGPGEPGLRAALARANDGDVIILTGHVELKATVEISKAVTIRARVQEPNSVVVLGDFTGDLFHLTASEVIFEGVSLTGNRKADGLLVERHVTLRDCSVAYLETPLKFADWWATDTLVRLERVVVTFNRFGLEAPNLEAKDCVFSFSGAPAAGPGAGAQTGQFDRCRFENNPGFGLVLNFGSVRDCTFRYNLGFGLWCDGDPGRIYVARSLFYANADGGLMVGEQVIANVENCTFTRHSGSATIYVSSDVSSARFEHCTIADNAFFASEPTARQREGTGAFTIERPGSVTLRNCIVADNATNGAPHAASLSGNWIDEGGNLIGGPARLGVLTSAGGATLSLVPLPDSPAIDAGVTTELLTDSRGLSRVAGPRPDAGAVEAQAVPLTDADADQMPDQWELQHHLDPALAADASSDFDGDGQSALSEYRSRTNPNDPSSCLRFLEMRLLPSNPSEPAPRTAYLLWNYVPGTDYELESSSDLRHWQKVPGVGYPSSTLDDRPALLFQIATDSPRTFYRVQAKPTL